MIACVLLNNFASASQRAREHRNSLAREKAYTVPLDVNASRDLDLADFYYFTGWKILNGFHRRIVPLNYIFGSIRMYLACMLLCSIQNSHILVQSATII